MCGEISTRSHIHFVRSPDGMEYMVASTKFSDLYGPGKVTISYVVNCITTLLGKQGASVAQWVKSWPDDLAVPGTSPA